MDISQEESYFGARASINHPPSDTEFQDFHPRRLVKFSEGTPRKQAKYADLSFLISMDYIWF